MTAQNESAMDADRPSSRNAGFEEVMKELLETADNKDSFGIVLRELLSKKDEIAAERERANEERAKVAKLEAVLAAKKEMDWKQEKLRERYEEARDAERKEAKEAQAALVEKMEQQQLRHETLLREERKEAQAQQKLLMEERRETQERQDLLMERLFEQQGKQTRLETSSSATAAAQKNNYNSSNNSNSNNNGNFEDAPSTTKTQFHMAGPPALIPTPTPQDFKQISISKAGQNPAPDEQEALWAVASEAGLGEAIQDDHQSQQWGKQQRQDPVAVSSRDNNGRSATLNVTTKINKKTSSFR